MMLTLTYVVKVMTPKKLREVLVIARYIKLLICNMVFNMTLTLMYNVKIMTQYDGFDSCPLIVKKLLLTRIKNSQLSSYDLDLM